MKTRHFTYAFLPIILAGVLAAFLAGRDDHITRANAARIVKGMTLREVENILGGPSGDHTGWPQPETDRIEIKGDDIPALIKPRTWFGEQGRVAVIFDEHDRVWQVSYDDLAPNDRGRFRRLLNMMDKWMRQRSQ